MFAPTVASVVVAKFVDRTSWRDAVGLRFRGRWRRILLWAPLAVLLVLGLNLATAVLMVLRGVPGDLTGRTWAAELTRTLSAQGVEMPTGAAIALVLVSAAFGVLLTVVPALGEEIGWRGWLRRELAPLGPWAAIVLGGVIWSLWHVPVTLIGHDYPGQPRWAAVAMFVPVCIALNHLYSAITERAGGNPIPAAFAHATLNSTLGLAIGVVATSGTPEGLNWFLDTPLGVTGIGLTSAVAFLIMPRRGRASGQAERAEPARAPGRRDAPSRPRGRADAPAHSARVPVAASCAAYSASRSIGSWSASRSTTGSGQSPRSRISSRSPPWFIDWWAMTPGSV